MDNKNPIDGGKAARRVSGGDSTGFLRQADAASHVGDIRSDAGTDGRRRGRGVGGLSDLCLVGLPAVVPAGIGVVDLLVPVPAAGDVAEDAVARQRCDVGGLHRGGRQRDADAAPECLPVYLFGANGLYDGLAHADHDEVSGQPAETGGTA